MKKFILTLLCASGIWLSLAAGSNAEPYTPASPLTPTSPYAPYAASSYGLPVHKRPGTFHFPKLHITLPSWLGGGNRANPH